MEQIFKQWSWGDCLNCLDNLITYSDNLVLVSGAKNSGKTTLKQELIKLLGSEFKIFSTFAEQQLNITTFIHNITAGFKIPCEQNTVPSWDPLQKVILSQPTVRWILVIDDAHKLSWENLNTLIRLYTVANKDSSHLSIILFAHNNLEYTLQNSVLKEIFENKFQKILLKPLTFDQMVKYLNSINIKLDNKSLRNIYEHSAGSIGVIKEQASKMLANKNNYIYKNLFINIINSTTVKTICCSGLMVAAYVLFNLVQTSDLPVATIELEKNVEQSQDIAEQTNIVVPQVQENLYADLQIQLNQLEQQVAELKVQLTELANTTATNTTADPVG